MSSILVIADLHLESGRPDISNCFFEFLTDVVESKKSVEAIYILGDLFEVWIGDDNQSALNQQVANVLYSVSQQIPIYFIHGNRDFLLGKRYAKQAGMTLLPEEHQITAFGKKILFMHGDQLCLDDVDYQKFRAKSRTWWWKALLLAMPLSFRQSKARKIRKQSMESKQSKNIEIMDVAEREVTRVMQESDCDWLVHGHTHRPNVHDLGDDKQRIVVGDWYTQGSVLELNENGAKLIQLDFSQ